MWAYDGMWIRANYMEEFEVSGVVESSRVKYGGGVQHTVVLDKPLKMRWRTEPATRLLVDHETVLQVADRNPSI